MDRVNAYLKSLVETEPTCTTMDGIVDRYREMAGFDWMWEKDNPWDYRSVHFPELETRSALEFIRPMLTPRQLTVLDEIDVRYQEWIEQGVFYKRYRDAWGGRFTWAGYREELQQRFGRSMPRSHWWLWPPEEAK